MDVSCVVTPAFSKFEKLTTNKCVPYGTEKLNPFTRCHHWRPSLIMCRTFKKVDENLFMRCLWDCMGRERSFTAFALFFSDDSWLHYILLKILYVLWWIMVLDHIPRKRGCAPKPRKTGTISRKCKHLYEYKHQNQTSKCKKKQLCSVLQVTLIWKNSIFQRISPQHSPSQFFKLLYPRLPTHFLCVDPTDREYNSYYPAQTSPTPTHKLLYAKYLQCRCFLHYEDLLWLNPADNSRSISLLTLN